MCGIVGMVGVSAVNQRIYDALTVLQHRGQDAAGIMTSQAGELFMRKDSGLVRDVFQQKHMLKLLGNVGIGHVRYPTAGADSANDAQPFYVNSPYGICLGHNGNLTNARELTEVLVREDRRHLNTRSDSEVLLNVLASELQRVGTPRVTAADIFAAANAVYRRCRGGYAVVAMVIGHGILGFRDPNGIRPLVVGRLDDAWVLASETCAFDLIGARVERELEPGEMVVIDERGARFSRTDVRSGSLCVFEYIYFARPDSVMRGRGLHEVRRNLGKQLALEAPVAADVVIGVPDSGTPAAVGYAEGSGIPFGEGLVKNRYVGRTFIQPDQALRERGVKLKFNALRSVLEGRRVVVVDDSIVRGSTTRKLVQMLFEVGAREVHLRVSSPPIVSPCFYGIDMADQDELIAAGRTVDEVRRRLGATSLAYLSLEGLETATGPADGFCRACLTGDYPTEIPVDMRLAKLRFEGPPVPVEIR